MAANQTSAMLKVNQISKDLNIKSKDLAEMLAKEGIEYKTQKTLEPNEFALFFDAITKEHQIKGIEDYLDGITYIPKKTNEAASKGESDAQVEAKPVEEKKPEPAKVSVEEPKKDTVKKTEEKAEEKPEKVVEKVAEKPAPKTEQPKEAVAENKPKEAESVSKAKPEPVKKVEAPKAAVAESKEKIEKVENQPKIEKVEKRESVRSASNDGANSHDTFNRQQRPERTNTMPRAGMQPQQGGFQGQPRGDRPPFGQQGQQPRNGFAPRNDRFGQPQGAPQGQQPRGDRPPFGQQNGQGGQRPPQQKPSFDKGGNRQMGGGFDKEDRQPSAPKKTFKRTEIVRGQNNSAPAQRGATRVVDMRGSSVDLSKYDEKLDNFVPDSISDMRGGMQRVKKQPAANNFAQQKNNKMKGKKSAQPVTKAPTSVTLPADIMVSDLASRLKVTTGEVIKRLMMLGMMVTANQTVDYDTAAIVAEEMGITATQEVVVTIEEKLFEEETDDESKLLPRAPVVCVMGHVDHGKTSILDAIRHTSVTTGEAGGITQHIGAYRVKAKGQDITFLDTPGHEAFTAMRARGAQSTDIAILVVAADDGIMPQTVEAINHAKAAGIDIVVAINKMDKPTANPDAVKQELTKYELVPEEWGGDVICVPVSALTGQGIDDLLESVLLVAEVKELKANPNRRAKGLVIEARLDKGRGPVATVLVQNGTLRSGDIVIAGTSVGRVRAMTDDKGRTVKEAKPSVPVEITGLAEVPSSGDEFNAVEDERMARMLADQRREQAKEEVFKANARANLNDLFAQISDGVKELNVIVKADVDGSVEAVKQSLEKLSNEEVKVRVIHGAAGGIREGDVTFAAASNAIIVGFNVRPDKAAIDSAERQNVDIRTYRVIYDCINEITDAMKGMLAPEYRENLLGHAEVRQTIHVPNVGTIAGSYIQDGKVSRNAMIRVVRDGVVIFEDKISSLKRFKDDAKEVAQGYECGIGLERFNDIKVGDVLEAYIMEEVER